MRRVHLSVIGLVSVGSLCPIDHKLLLPNILEMIRMIKMIRIIRIIPMIRIMGMIRMIWMIVVWLGDHKEFLDNFR